MDNSIGYDQILQLVVSDLGLYSLLMSVFWNASCVYDSLVLTCWFSVVFFLFFQIIATDKRGDPHNNFFVSQRKHMLWVLITSASSRRF